MYSKIKSFFSSVFKVWEPVATFFSFIFTLMGLKNLWSFEGRQNNSLKKRIGLTLFYLCHIAAIILAAGLLGELLVTVPVATVLVSATSLINDYFEYFNEQVQNYKRNKDLNNLQNQLSQYNIDFEQNALFFEDVAQCQAELHFLKTQGEELKFFLSEIEVEGNGNSANQFKLIEEIAATLKEKYDSHINENEVIYNFYQIYGQNLDEYQIIKDTNEEVKLANARKAQLQREIRRFGISEKIKQEMAQLDSSIKAHGIVNQHFFKLIKSKSILVELQNQLDNIDQKYLQPPFSSYTAYEIYQIKKFESDYLQERIQSLQHIIQQAKNPSPQGDDDALNFDKKDYEELINYQKNPSKEAFIKILKNQIQKINKLTTELGKSLNAKEKYLNVITTNPKQELPADLSNIFKTAKAANDIKNEITLAKLEVKHKLWSTTFSIITACLAIALCYVSFLTPIGLLDNLMQFVSVLAGLTSLVGAYQNRQAKKQIQSQESIQIQQIVNSCKLRAAGIKNPEMRLDVDKKIGSLINSLKGSQPPANNPLGSESARVYQPSAGAQPSPIPPVVPPAPQDRLSPGLGNR